MDARNAFNPTMVRLLLKTVETYCSKFERFQSHNGAIAAGGVALSGTIIDDFQSHNGAIAALPERLLAVLG